MREGASQEKFNWNELFPIWPCIDNGKSYVGVRISRVNHKLRPNTAHIYESSRPEILATLYPLQDKTAGITSCIY